MQGQIDTLTHFSPHQLIWTILAAYLIFLLPDCVFAPLPAAGAAQPAEENALVGRCDRTSVAGHEQGRRSEASIEHGGFDVA